MAYRYSWLFFLINLLFSVSLIFYSKPFPIAGLFYTVYFNTASFLRVFSAIVFYKPFHNTPLYSWHLFTVVLPMSCLLLCKKENIKDINQTHFHISHSRVFLLAVMNTSYKYALKAGYEGLLINLRFLWVRGILTPSLRARVAFCFS